MIIRVNNSQHHTNKKIEELELQNYTVVRKQSISDVVFNSLQIDLFDDNIIYYVKNDNTIFKKEIMWARLPSNLFLEYESIDKRTKFYTQHKSMIEEITTKHDKQALNELKIKDLDKLYHLCGDNLDKTLLEYEKVVALGITIEDALKGGCLVLDDSLDIFKIVNLLLTRDIECLKHTEFITDNIFAILTLMFNNYRNAILFDCIGNDLTGFQKKNVYVIKPFYTDEELIKFINFVYYVENSIKQGEILQIHAGKFIITELLDKPSTN